VNGNTYIGEFKNASFTGQGTMNYANGNKYISEIGNKCAIPTKQIARLI